MSDDIANFEEKLYRIDSWRVFRFISEFVDSFEKLTEIGTSVSIFGSTRLKAPSPYYNKAIDVAQKIGEWSFAAITGGCPANVEAANKGAVGIDVPMELETSPFIDPKYRLKFRYFFVRKVMFIHYERGCAPLL